jgi:hypothetical protein
MEHFCSSIDRKDGMGIHLGKIDTFFTTVSDLYTTVIENGLLAIDYEHIRFESTHTTMFFTTGLKCIEHAATTPNHRDNVRILIIIRISRPLGIFS